MRRIVGIPADVRAVGLRSPDAGLDHAFAALHRVLASAGTPVLPVGKRGEAVDQAVATLRAGGATKGMVNLGGVNLAVFGEPITVAVHDPQSEGGPRWATFELDEAALGSRGTPPRTPEGRVLWATVVARSAAEAEALADAAVALAADEALALLAQRGASGFVQLTEGGRKVVRATPGFANARHLEAEPDVTVRP